MNILKTGAIGIFGTLATSSVIEKSMKNYDTDIIPAIDTVSIIIPSYNEESFIETAILSLRDQSIIHNYPHSFEFILVDSQSTDKTVQIAKPYIDKIILSPRGKLTARDMAINSASGNIIVSVDADTFYPHHWLNTLLKPFIDSKYYNVVGVNGSTIDKSIVGVPGPVRNIMELFDNMIYPYKMLGRNSAFYKHAYFLVGGFDKSANQLSVKDMVFEEEISFGDKLSKIGTVVYKMNASCIHLGGSKISCRWNFKDKDSCASYGIGVDRF
jgi:glycosyltransferase involved in cell wall biosynthesis